MRAGSRSRATPVMEDGAISRRSRPPAVSAMSTTLPLTLCTPMSAGSTGARAASVDRLASAKPSRPVARSASATMVAGLPAIRRAMTATASPAAKAAQPAQTCGSAGRAK